MKHLLPLLVLIACASAPVSRGRTPAEMHALTVQIRTTCATPDPDFVSTGDPVADGLLKVLLPDVESAYGGSGLLVSQDRLLTNGHVVTCEPPSELRSILINDGDGELRPAHVELLLPRRDIARVQLDVPLKKHVPRPVIGPRPATGDRLCYSSALPIQQVRCGDVQPNDNPKSGSIYVDALVMHGSSGSSAYVDGRLVGLVYATLDCGEGGLCIGAVTPIDDALAWLLP